MSDDDYQRERGWRFPGGIDVPESTWYRIPFGDDAVNDQKWEGHVDMAHQQGLEAMDTEVVDSGVDDDGIRYAAVKVTVVLDGETYSSLGSADEMSNQVRDPENVWVVAESRALKRAVKKALNILPVDEDAAKADSAEPPADEIDGTEAVDIDSANREINVDHGADTGGEW